MLADRNKISLRQALLLFIIVTSSPALRLFGSYTADIAKQSGWLAPLFSFIVFSALILVIHGIYKATHKESFADIIYEATGKVIGKILVSMYGLWITVLLALYVRYYAERIVSTVTTNTYISTYIGIMLVVVALVLRSGIVVLARMNEIIFVLIVFTYLLLNLLNIPNVKIDNLLPVNYIDILPVVKSSYVILAIYGYIVFLFFFGDEINNKEKIKAEGIKAALVLTFLSTTLIIMVIGTLGYNIARRLPLPFYTSIKEISVFGFLEKMEPVAVAQWVLGDFVLISVFTYSVLKILKSILGLSDTKPIIVPFLVFIYFFSLYLTNNRFELAQFSNHIALDLNMVFAFIIPGIIFIIARIKKMIKKRLIERPGQA